MNALKRAFGLVWILLAPVCLFLIVTNALQAFAKADKTIAAAKETAKAAAAAAQKLPAAAAIKLVAAEAAKVATAEAAKTNTVLQWSIIIVIFLPIAFGLIIFGKYAVAGEYDLGKPQPAK